MRFWFIMRLAAKAPRRRRPVSSTLGVIEERSVVSVAPYSQQYQSDVVDLILEIQRMEFGFDIRAEDQPDLLDVQNFYLSGAGGFWLALEQNVLVGTIALRDIGNRQGALRKMFVREAFRGREHSVAKTLLSALIKSAQASGLEEIYLGTTERFLAAHRFYEKHGFMQVAPDELPTSFPRMSLDTRFYLLVIRRRDA
jgi:N-acetylglutamate synthase-like GNAT family acetyltransferase